MTQVFDFENVNGVILSLNVERQSDSPKSRKFTITFKNVTKKSSWGKYSLFLAVLFNIFAIFYVRISLLAVVIIVTVLAFLVYLWITHSVQSESVLVIPCVGIQSTVKYVYGSEDEFMPWPSVDDVIINEVIKLNRVLYYLTVIMRTDTESDPVKLVPLFKYTRPRLVMLEKVYNEMQALLTEQINLPMGQGDTG